MHFKGESDILILTLPKSVIHTIGLNIFYHYVPLNTIYSV